MEQEGLDCLHLAQVGDDTCKHVNVRSCLTKCVCVCVCVCVCIIALLDERLLAFQYLFRCRCIFYRTCENETNTWASVNIIACQRY